MILPLILFAQLQQPHFRNTFATAVESVVDTLSAVDITASPTDYGEAMKSAQAARTNLNAMATEEGEHDVVSSVNDLYFAISACHIQATDHSDTTTCRAQIDHARTRVMTVLGRHKANGSWIDGPPS